MTVFVLFELLFCDVTGRGPCWVPVVGGGSVEDESVPLLFEFPSVQWWNIKKRKIHVELVHN